MTNSGRRTLVELDPTIDLDFPRERAVGIEWQLEVLEDMFWVFIQKAVGSENGEG